MDFSNLTDDQKATIERMLEQYQSGTLGTQSGTRSPIPGPLKDLRDPGEPSKRLHRASFFFQTADSYTTPREYPKVKWHQNGTDTLVLTRAAEDALGAEWGDTPSGKAISASERAKQEMMALTPEEQELVRTSMREARLAKIREAMSELSPAELDGFLHGEATEPVKRGPGRPRKLDV